LIKTGRPRLVSIYASGINAPSFWYQSRNDFSTNLASSGHQYLWLYGPICAIFIFTGAKYTALNLDMYYAGVWVVLSSPPDSDPLNTLDNDATFLGNLLVTPLQVHIRGVPKIYCLLRWEFFEHISGASSPNAGPELFPLIHAAQYVSGSPLC
jgi:hypothetical protein